MKSIELFAKCYGMPKKGLNGDQMMHNLAFNSVLAYYYNNMTFITDLIILYNVVGICLLNVMICLNRD